MAALSLSDLPRLVTVKVAAEYLGITESQVRSLVAAGQMARTPVGARVLIPREALDQFIIENTVSPCRAETPGRASGFSTSANVIISSGPKVDAAASAQRALRTAQSLKPPSLTSSTSARGTPARVIPLKSS
jgi:excisionase family DNA binding protein